MQSNTSPSITGTSMSSIVTLADQVGYRAQAKTEP